MDLTKTAEALKKRGYEVSCFGTGAEAAAYLNGKIDGMTVGFGDSETLLQMHLFEMLQTHNDVYHPKYPREGKTTCITLNIQGKGKISIPLRRTASLRISSCCLPMGWQRQGRL